MKTSENHKIKPSRISALSPKPLKNQYTNIMAYTVNCTCTCLYVAGLLNPEV